MKLYYPRVHLLQLDHETTHCGLSRLRNTKRKKVSTDRITVEIEKVTCKSCIKLHDKELGITPYLLYPDQDLSHWSKITCEENCGSLGDGTETPYPIEEDDYPNPKPGCIVTATANQLATEWSIIIEAVTEATNELCKIYYPQTQQTESSHNITLKSKKV